MSATPRTLVMTATYNEIDNLPRLVEAVQEALPEAHILVVDDSSPDGTGDWVDRRARTDSRIHALHRPGKLGLGTAILAGMKYAIENGYDYLVNMDADFSHPPQNIPDLVAAMSRPGADQVAVAIGSRYIPGGGIEGWPLRRYLMSVGINIYARFLLRLKPRDASGGYRCYRVSRLAELDFSEMRSRGYSFQQEILWRLVRRGARVEETPIVFVDRACGQSKINMKVATSALGIIARLGLETWFTRPPQRP
jgi:dolichol-phosphate mannosyltransferase